MGTELNNAVFVTPSTKIRFKCTGCGDCCRHVTESVPVSCQDAFYLTKYLRDTGSDIYCIDQFGQLDDYAVYTLALLELYRTTLNADYLQKAIQRSNQMVELFEDKEQGGYFMTASDGELLIARPKETYDGAIPSGNSVAAMVLQRLASLTGELKWQEAARRQMQFLADNISDYPASSCFGILSMMDALYPHWEPPEIF